MVWRASPDTGLGGTLGGSVDINLEISECVSLSFSLRYTENQTTDRHGTAYWALLS